MWILEGEECSLSPYIPPGQRISIKKSKSASRKVKVHLEKLILNINTASQVGFKAKVRAEIHNYIKSCSYPHTITCEQKNEKCVA